MRSVLRKTLTLTAALGAAVAVFVLLTLPPASITIGTTIAPGVAYGAFHVHTIVSDGSGSNDDVARAAAGAGLQFVITTDHGDATRVPNRPEYRHGVLLIEAVEIGSDDGHVVALGLRGAAPYPLGGRAIDVLEDVHRLGGWAIAAHPDSPRPGLRWQAAAAPYDGVEWLNLDSEWRDEAGMRLLATAARSVFRGPEAIASLFDRPARSFRRWDTAARIRPVVGLAAVDAHARIAGAEEEGGAGGSTLLAWPGYGQMFRTVSQAVILDGPLGNDAHADATRILDAIEAGRTYSIVRAIGWPATLDFTAEAAGRTVGPGGRLAAGAITFRARVPEASEARLTLFANGVPIATGQGSLTSAAAVDDGVYRIEASLTDAAVPWLVSNPIYVGPAPDPPSDTPPLAAATSRLVLEPGAAWAIEHDPASNGSATVEAAQLRFDFTLGPGIPAGQFAALTTSVGGETGFDRLQFVARAAEPMRLSVQARLPPGGEGQRWRRSVYIDDTPRLIVIRLEDLQPVDAGTTQRPLVSHVRGVLFVVDTVNTSPGASGTIWLKDIALGIGAVGGG